MPPRLSAAIEKFGAAAEQAVQQTMRELQEMRREQASSLVIPDAAGGAAAESQRSARRGGRARGAKTPPLSVSSSSQRAYAVSSSAASALQALQRGAAARDRSRWNARGSLISASAAPHLFGLQSLE